MTTPQYMLRTVNGDITADEAGRILVHEHIMVGFVEDGKLSEQDYNRNEVAHHILPLLQQLRQAGCSTLVDCAPAFLGRDAYLLKELSIASGIHLITNTGLYKSPYLPSYAYEMSEQQLAELWVNEASHGIGGSQVLPGFIKIALNEGETLDPTQIIILQAAIRASQQTGLPIQCHAVGNHNIIQANEIMKAAGFDRERFIWIHAQSCTDLRIQQQLASEGMWISIDSILPDHYPQHVELLQQLLALGLGDKLLLSQDTGWYNVGQENGGIIHPYHRLFSEFIPFAAAHGINADWLDQSVTSKPFMAMRLRAASQ